MDGGRRQQGITLLEVLLVVCIAAVIVTAAVSYYSQTMRYTRVANTVNFLQQVNKAGHEWLQIPNQSGVYPADFSGLGNGDGLQILVNQQLLSCPNNSCSNNAWGGTNAIYATTPQYIMIVLTKITTGDCQLLQNQMQNSVPQGIQHQNYCQPSNSSSTSYQVYL
jgi:Tfp pilus assembly protein PilV